jgi:hypothetical protein
MTTRIKQTAVLFFFFFLQSVLFIGEAFAQTPPPSGGLNEGAPLDGMTTTLLAAGAAYGIRKMRNRDKK